MARKEKLFRRVNQRFALPLAIVALLMTAACNSKSSSKDSMERTGGQGSSTAGKNIAAQSNPDPGIDLNCVYERLQNPPEAFHYLYKKDGTNQVHQEADVTPQSIDGFRTQDDGSQQPLHATRADQQSWRSALAGLTGISGMSSTVATINHNSAMKRESDGGPVNGYNTIHYSIDTGRFTPTEHGILLSPGEFEKGDAWVTSTGCPIKLSLDSELHQRDGTLIERLHYEESMEKK
jgi:aminopeptidase C